MNEDAAWAYLAFLARMRAETVDELARYCERDVRFRDPFHDTRGVEAYQAVCRAMFRQIDMVAFEPSARTYAEGICRFEWTLRYRFRSAILPKAPDAIPGASVVRFNPRGLVTEHLDYWDAGALYGRMPVMGPLLRAIRRRISAQAS